MIKIEIYAYHFLVDSTTLVVNVVVLILIEIGYITLIQHRITVYNALEREGNLEFVTADFFHRITSLKRNDTWQS